MPSLFIHIRLYGAGKTTASFTVLPDLLKIREFVNADEIARGLSPFQPEKVSLEAGRIMLNRIHELVENNKNFAFETTLSSRSFVPFIYDVRNSGYTVNLLFFWLENSKLAIERVRQRVVEGGHDIPIDVITRRYANGLKNFNTLYKDIVDYWLVFDNSKSSPELIAEGSPNVSNSVYQKNKWSIIQTYTGDE